MPSLAGRRWVWILLGLVAAVVLVERLIVTDAESIEALVEDAEEAGNARDWDALLGLLSPEFVYEGRDREETVALVQRLVTRFDPQGVTFSISKLEIQGDRATARARINVRALGRVLPLASDVSFARTPDGWALAAATAAFPSLR